MKIWIDWADGRYTWNDYGVGFEAEVDDDFILRLQEIDRLDRAMQDELQVISNAAYEREYPDS